MAQGKLSIKKDKGKGKAGLKIKGKKKPEVEEQEELEEEEQEEEETGGEDDVPFDPDPKPEGKKDKKKKKGKGKKGKKGKTISATAEITKDDETEVIPVELEAVEMDGTGEMATVGFSLNRTFNLGEYESVKLGIHISVPCPPTDDGIEGAFDSAKEWTEQKLQECMDQYELETEDD